MRTVFGCLIAVLCAWVLFVLPAHASEGPEPVLHIKTYTSPSGQYALVVDPSHLHGRGQGSYRLTRAGTEVYTQDLSFTLWDAAVSDDGVVAGYGYSNGWRGWSEQRGDQSRGDLIIALINPDGSSRLVKKTPREVRGFDSPPEPLARGFFLDAANDRVVYRFDAGGDRLDDRSERWESYRLSTGESLPDATFAPFKPAEEGYSFITDATPLAGTGLILAIQAITRWAQPRHEGLYLSLINKDGQEVWSQEWPDEFSSIERFSPWDLKPAGIIITQGMPAGSFALRSVAAQSRLTFTATADPAAKTGWSVA